jgi:hypothetical protein
VLFALVIAFVLQLIFGQSRVHAQEAAQVV